MLSAIITRIVDASRRFALAVVAMAIVLTALLGWYAATHFAINTDVNRLLSDDLPWRQQEKALEKAFPQNIDQLVIVVDGKTADETENAAALLTARLSALTSQFTMVERPDAIPFFRKNGLLFLSAPELTGTLDQLVQAQPLLGMLASDPSVRGLASMLDLMTKGLQIGQLDYSRLDAPFSKIADTVEAALAGQDKPLALQSLGSADKPAARDLRKFILTKPVLDYGDLESGASARATVRSLVKELQLTPDHGVTVRMTGSVALNDEEFSSVVKGMGFATIASGILVLVLLLLALRSLKIVIPILLTLFVGFVWTLAFALATVGSLNMISVAFAVMFIGIAVDFGIQFGVRYRDQHYLEPRHDRAMKNTAEIIAVPLTMAAASTALGFFAFIPTAYRGVSELGLIAGGGMLIAYALNLTLLPALLSITKPPAERESIGFAWAAPLDEIIVKHRHKILIAAMVATFAGLAVASQLRFDFDPLNLKDPTTESVATMFDVMKDPDSGAYALDVLRPTLHEAEALAERAAELPEVDHAMTLSSFVPQDQAAKMATIADAQTLLQPTMEMAPLPPPIDENIDTLKKLAADLHTVGKDHTSAERLAIAFDDVVQRHDEKLMNRLQANLITVMQSNLDIVKNMLTAEAVTADNITDDLKRDWVTADGMYRVQIHPKGNPRDHATLLAFTQAVKSIAPDAAGTPVSIQASGDTVTGAFTEAGFLAIVVIAVLSFIVLRNWMDVARMMAPLILAGILTLATMVLIGLPLNFANIIALPLLLSLGVSYAIYFVSYSRAGHNFPLQSSMARAVLFSAATVLTAFGSLALSSHLGTAGMGELLTVALLYSVSFTFLVLPALLAPDKTDKS